MIRAGIYRPVHVKTLRSQKLRMLLTHRKLLQSKRTCAIALQISDFGCCSTRRCNTNIESLRVGFKSQCVSRPLIKLTRHFVQVGLRIHRQVGSFREILSQQTTGILIGTALPWALRIAEVNNRISRQSKSSMIVMGRFPDLDQTV